MFFGISKKEKTNPWSDILITFVLTRFIWFLIQRGILPTPLVAILIIAFVCLFLLAKGIAKELLSLAGVLFFLLETTFSGLPNLALFLILCLIIIMVRIFLSPIFGEWEEILHAESSER